MHAYSYLFAAQADTAMRSAYHARDLVTHRSDGIGTLMSVFPSNYSDAPLQGLPIGGLEYFAPGPEGDLYILAMPISKQISNVLGSEAHNATVAIKDEDAERRLGRFGATDRNRAVLFGSLERLHDAHDVKDAERAFAKYHKDAVEYFPGKGPHYAFWARFRVDRIYWIGGFGEWVDRTLLYQSGRS